MLRWRHEVREFNEDSNECQYKSTSAGVMRPASADESREGGWGARGAAHGE